MKIPIKKLSQNAVIPTYGTKGAAAFDLTTIESKILHPGEIHIFKTGLVFCIPDGFFMLVASRSSNPTKKGINLANSIGIIDSDYCGENDELGIITQNITNKPVSVKAGDRIAQAMILPVQQITFELVKNTGSNNRGGIGSTGM